jgi:hypothetical protein
MRKTLLFFIITLFTIPRAFSQTDTVVQHKIKFEHYAGVQMNELIRQVFNFNNSTTNNNTNPYLFIYSMNLTKNGWGLRTGIGYNYADFSDDDGITKKDTKLNDLKFRLGIEKKYALSNKWSTGVGFDLLYNINDDKTVTTIRGTTTSTTETVSTISSYGVGGMAWLRYHVTPKILIGTESSFYFTTGNTKQDINISVEDPNSPGFPPQTSSSSIDKRSSSGSFSMPVAFFIIVKF